MEKSVAEREKELKDSIRRLEREPHLKGPQRKEMLVRLIDLAHSQHSALKIVAAGGIKHFIAEIPELEDDAINAVYDLCEDPVSKVRIAGYEAIAELSQVQTKWVGRNADVLVQLLQSDDPLEVSVVKTSLLKHLELDPVVTISVLCDQLLPPIYPPDEPIDVEEQVIRDRLRSLVLSFLTGEAKRSIINIKAESEKVLVGGLLKAIPKLPPADIDIIVKNLLLSLPAFKPYSSRGEELLEVILNEAKITIKADLSSGNERSPLTASRYFLNLASFIVVDKMLASPAHFLRFYCTNLATKMTLQKLSEDAQIFVIFAIAAISDLCEDKPLQGSGPSEEELISVRKQIVDTAAVLLQVFSETKLGDRRPWAACRSLIHACVWRKNALGWAVPSHLSTILQNVKTLLEQAKVDGMEDIHSLIRSLLQPVKPQTQTQPQPPAPPPATAYNAPANTNMKPKGRNNGSVVTIKRDFNIRPNSLPARPMTVLGGTPSGPRMDIRPQAPSGRPRMETMITDAPSNGRSWDRSPHDQPRSPKRAKKGGGIEGNGPPSLLSRLGSTPTLGSPSPYEFAAPSSHSMSSIPAKRRAEPPLSFQRRPQEIDPDQPPAGGYTIRGAARRVSPQSDPILSRSSSLLERMNDARSDDDDWDGRKKKKRTKAS